MIMIELFGKFSIKVDGEDATYALGNSKKGRLMLEYLILHRDESIASSDLYELLWPDEEIANPESALKTLVSRTRSALGRVDQALGKCILTIRGAYRWNTNLPHEVDVFAFEALCAELSAAQTMDEEIEARLDQALKLYKGDLGAFADSGNWIISRNAYYHSLFVKTIHHGIYLYKTIEDFDSVIRICRRGLEADLLDETMHLELMRALVRKNRSNEALIHYHRTKDLHYNQFGLMLPDSIQKCYREIIQADYSLDMDIDSIRRSLNQNCKTKGACICEYAIFHELYRPLVQGVQRMGKNPLLAMVMILPENSKAFKNPSGLLEKAMNQLLTIILGALREGDVVSRYSPSQYVLLLPSLNPDKARAMLDSIRQQFSSGQPDGTLKVTSRLAPVESA